MHTLEVFEQSPEIESVILVGNEEHLSDFEKMVKQYQLKKVTRIVAGGKTRRESVANGLAALDPDTDIVVVHDSARPLVSLKVISEAVGLCQNSEAVVVAVPVTSTIKRVNASDLSVEATLRRDGLWEVQTPQVFKKELLIKAHKRKKKTAPTDDAMLVESLGVRVKVLPGDYTNIKITTQEDLTMAKSLLGSRKQ